MCVLKNNTEYCSRTQLRPWAFPLFHSKREKHFLLILVSIEVEYAISKIAIFPTT